MPSASPLPDAETIRRTAAEVMRRPAYQLDPQAESATSFLELLLRFIKWISGPFRWLSEALSDLPGWLRWPIVVGLSALVILLILHIIYTIAIAVRGPKRKSGLSASAARTQRDPAALEREAAQALARGDYIAAVRLLFRACLLRLETLERRTARIGATNREHLRHHQDSPVFEPLRVFVDIIDTKWYGRGDCGRDDYEACLAAHARINQLAKDGLHAHSP